LLAVQALTPGAIADNFQIITANNFKAEVADFLEPFRKLWDDRFNKLETIMKKYKSKRIE